MAEWLECAVAVQDVSGMSPSWGRHKNPRGCKEPSDYVSFHRTVKIQWFHTLNTHDTKPITTQQHSLQMLYALELDLVPFPSDVARSFPSE